jgi:hypothetical protein
MHKFWALSFLLVVASVTLACGSGRQLQSINISQTVNGEQIQFVATGIFSAPPTTVTPLPVDWMILPTRPTLQPPQHPYTLTTQPFVVTCPTEEGSGFAAVAFAPPDPNAPASGSVSKVITQSSAINCP